MLRFRLKTLALVITAFAVLTWYYTKTRSSVESAYWGQLKRVPAADVRSSFNGLRLWYQQTEKDAPKNLVALCENEQVDSTDSVRALLIDASRFENIYLARQTSPNSAVLIATEGDGDLVTGIAAITMVLDKLNHQIDEPVRPELGGTHPVFVNAMGVGRFEVYFINDWGHYATTRLKGPRSVVTVYDTLARNDKFDLRNSRGTTR